MPLTLIALSKADDKDADLVWSVIASTARNSANTKQRGPVVSTHRQTAPCT